MGITALSNNLTQVSPAARSKFNVGYKVQPTVQETAVIAHCDTYENSEIAEKVKSQIKDRIANLEVLNILDVKGKPITDAPNYLQFSERTVVGRDGSTFQMGYTFP